MDLCYKKCFLKKPFRLKEVKQKGYSDSEEGMKSTGNVEIQVYVVCVYVHICACIYTNTHMHTYIYFYSHNFFFPFWTSLKHIYNFLKQK